MASFASGRSPITASSSSNSRTSLISSEVFSKPIGIKLFGLCFKFNSVRAKRNYHKALVLILTYIAYTAFHMGRRPLSIVKNVLNRNCSALSDHIHQAEVSEPSYNAPFEISVFSVQNTTFTSSSSTTSSPQITDQTTDNSCNWAPFDDDTTANQLLAILDSSFLLAYALLMFVSGIVAERMNLRYFISAGSILSGIGLIAFGFAYSLNIHSMTYFIIVQILSGAAQTTGWPVVVTCVSNWFEPAKRGLIYGLWNSHTNVGNILGATIAGYYVEKDWGLSFIVPGIIMISVGCILYLFLVPTPQDVDLSPTASNLLEGSLKPHGTPTTITRYDSSLDQSEKGISDGRRTNSKSDERLHETSGKAVSFLTALKIPGVIEYSLCLFFSKLVSYTFLYWLPRYITSSTSNNSEDSAYLSTPFDIGGVAGAILAGYFSDAFNANGITCNVMLLLAIPSMFLYQRIGSLSTANNISLQLLCGALVNGPYCLITTAVSADLGSRVKDGRAMATVAAIIDGMGSIGAVIGPLFAGFVSSSGGDWQAVFLMLILADVLASFCLIRLTAREIKDKFFKQTAPSNSETVVTT